MKLVILILCGFVLITWSNSLIAEDSISDEIQHILANKGLWGGLTKKIETLDAGKINHVLKDFDPYARYIPPKASKINKPQEFTGYLGIDFFNYKGDVWLQTISDGAASQAGMPEFSVLNSVGKTSVKGLNLSNVSELIDNAIKSDSTVLLGVSLAPRMPNANYKVQSSKIKSELFEWKKNEDYLIIKINNFDAHIASTAIFARYKILVSDGTKVVLDLRRNSGGSLFEAIDIAGMIVPEGKLLGYTINKNGVIKKYYSPSGEKLKAPYGILIDKRTASAAEVLAGILQYNKNSILAGERTYGKCLSQTIEPLSNGGSLIYTNMEFRFPNNKTCTGLGLLPDNQINDITIKSFSRSFFMLRK